MRFDESSSKNLTTPTLTSGRYSSSASPIATAMGQDLSNFVTLTPQGSNNLTNPFTISIGRHGAYDPSLDGTTLVLLIPPSTLSVSSNQIVDAQFTREGFLPSIWGSSQLTLSASGSSPAFLTDKTGLAGPIGPDGEHSRTKSLGYAHLMSLVALYRSNGYQRLLDYEDPYTGRSLGGRRVDTSRVVHVLDAVKISYDGTTYFGHFSSFTLTPAAPYRFEYSFEFTASGIEGDIAEGDIAEGHLCDGVNQESGIVLARQGSSITTYRNQWSAKSAVQSYLEIGSASAYATDGNGAAPADPTGVTGVPAENEALFKQFNDALAAKGMLMKITSGFRGTPAAQAQANASNGFTTAFGHSYHNYGAAIDINILLPNHKVLRMGSPLADWRASGAVAIAEGLGFTWGGDFTKPDPVHFDLRKKVGTIAQLRSKYQAASSPDGEDPAAATGIE